MNPLISKARRPKFDLTLRIIDLNNVPLATGTSLIKYTLPSSATTGEHTFRTPSNPIHDHKVLYDYTKTISIRLTIDKANHLSECLISFEILQDFSSTAKSDRVCLGTVTLNLAEYVEESEEEEVVRRYLLQDSKINSTVRIGVSMKQVDGERGFVAPALKTVGVFGGIAGIMAGEQDGVGGDEVGHLPNLSKTRDHSELHDIYRRSLAASWAAQPGELPADQCVEDIFNGGTGWTTPPTSPYYSSHQSSSQSHNHNYPQTQHPSSTYLSSHQSDGPGSGHGRHPSNVSEKTSTSKMGHKHHNSASQETLVLGPRKGERESDSDGERGMDTRSAREVEEFRVRDDLIAWRLPGVAKA